LIVQTAGVEELKLTGNPEDAIAPISKSVSPYTLLTRAAKLIDCSTLVSNCVSSQKTVAKDHAHNGQSITRLSAIDQRYLFL